MIGLPEPPVPADADLRNFPDMPLAVLRLRDSDLATTPDAEAFRGAVLSWCVSWHQVPAGSLPDDDATLARLLGWGRDLKGWRKVRAAAMRGWTRHGDGRLYHPVVAEKVCAALGFKNAARRKREKDAERLAAWRRSRGETVDETRSETLGETRFTPERQDRIGSDRIGEDNLNRAPSPPPAVSPREDYTATAATGPLASPPGERKLDIPTAVHRFRAANAPAIRAAAKKRDLLGIVRGFGADSTHQDWPSATDGMVLGLVVAIFGWSLERGFAIRAPSGFRKSTERWSELPIDDRRDFARLQCGLYGIRVPA